MLNHVALNGGRVAVSLTAISLHMSTFMVGFLVALFAVLPMLFSVYTGRWVDRIGVSRPMRIGNALIIVGAATPLIWSDLTALVLAAGMIGIGFTLHQVSTQNLMGRGDSKQRLRNFSWLALAQSVSGFSGPLLAGLAIDHLGHRFAFGVLAIGPIIALYGLRKLLPTLPPHVASAPEHKVEELPEPAPLTATEQQQADMQAKAPKPGIRDLLRIAELRRILGTNTVLSGAWDTHAFIVPIYGVSIGLSATTIGTVLACFSLATFVIRLALPYIQKHVRPWTLLVSATISAGCIFLLYPLFREISFLLTLSFILGLALGGSQPSLLALMHQHSPPGRTAETVGLRLALLNSTQVMLPMSFGALGNAIGIAPLFWAYALLLYGSSWLNRDKFDRFKKKKPAPPAAPPETSTAEPASIPKSASTTPSEPAPAPGSTPAPASGSATRALTQAPAQPTPTALPAQGPAPLPPSLPEQAGTTQRTEPSNPTPAEPASTSSPPIAS